MTYSQNIPPDSLLSFGKNRKIEKIKRKENIISIYIYIYFWGTFQTFNFSPGTTTMPQQQKQKHATLCTTNELKVNKGFFLLGN
jgi:hypothetical protein